MNIPSELKYTKDHEWVRIEGNQAIVGITDFAQDQLGEVVFVENEREGDTIDANEVFGSIEAVKTVSDLLMPLTGEIVEVNAALEDQPELVNNDPYGEGWMIKVAIANEAEIAGLLDAEAYAAHIA